jgi:GT2 family glycosyltransferase/SAM-dependent methyltransferase
MTVERPGEAGLATTSAVAGEYWSRKLQSVAFSPACYWRLNPLVHQLLVAEETDGGPWRDWVEYCVRFHLAGRTPVARMLSIGCGNGQLERRLAELGAFVRCDAWDIAAGAIETAKKLADVGGFSGIDYQVRDITTAELPPASYDAVWFENSLHHIEPLEAVCAAVARSLKPGGWLFLNEYVGPPRFAFPPRQRELLRAVFALIPSRLRRHQESGLVLTSVAVPSPGEVERDDPTEAVRSDEIARIVADHFDVVAFHPVAGALLQFLLNGIAGNFRQGDDESERVLELLFHLERELRALGELGVDFAVIAARPKGSETRAAGPPVPTLPAAGNQGEPTLVTLEEELSQRRQALEAAERYARRLEAELVQKTEHEARVTTYVRGLEARIASLELREPVTRRVFAVIVHHRGRSLLDHCLRRLDQSSSVDLTTLVVANACEESLPEVALGRGDLHVLRVDTPLGFSAANNHAISWARQHLQAPDHWFFLNNDTAVEPDTIQRLVAAIEATPQAGIAGPLLRIWGAEDHLNSLGLNLTEIGEAWDEGIGIRLEEYGPIPRRREVLAVTGSALLVRDELLAEVGGWNELYGYYMEDLDLCLQARESGWRVIHEPTAVAFHAISATADQRQDFKRLLSWRNQRLLLLRHWPIGLLLRVAPRILAAELAVYFRRLRIGAKQDAQLQARAFFGALRLAPRALAQRLRTRRRDTTWVRGLRPAGSVPVIQLPTVAPGRRPWEALQEDPAGGPEHAPREVTE